MHRAQDDHIARLVAGGRIHAVDISRQEQIGDQPFETIVLGGQKSELLDVGDAVLGPFILEADGSPDTLP